jgi:hypothetical protein
MNKDECFKIAWKSYPKKLGKRDSIKHFKKLINTPEDFNNLLQGIDNYKKYIERHVSEYQFILHGSTFFYNWEEWYEYEEPTVKLKEESNEPEREWL